MPAVVGWPAARDGRGLRCFFDRMMTVRWPRNPRKDTEKMVLKVFAISVFFRGFRGYK